MLRKIAEYVKKIFRMEPIPTTANTLREALQALEVARNHFENCDPEFVTTAIFELNAAEYRVDAARRNLMTGIPTVIPKMRRTI